MKYPKSMTILGQEVAVNIIDQPLYQRHICPKCVFKGENFSFPVPTGTSKACPACGCEETIPVENSYVLGQFAVKENAITNWHNEEYLKSFPHVREVCETSFVHETVEAINSIGDLHLPHQTITTLASMLYQAFSTGGVDFAEYGNYAEAA